MKKKLILIIGLTTLGLSLTACNKEKDPKTDKEKVSYAIGQQIGRGIKMQEIDVDLDMLRQSIKEALDEKEPRMKPEEMQQAMMEMQKQRMENRRKQAEENVKKGKDYLEKNKANEGVKVTESGLQYKVITEGTGKSPSDSDTVRVHYRGTLIDGKEFDSSYK
ncbi:MAG: FKBP-type peptidyl-prolyl cis-trans isomerase N-terminal domain-containing protein, partial [Bdellovibrionales bacterium]